MKKINLLKKNLEKIIKIIDIKKAIIIGIFILFIRRFTIFIRKYEIHER